MSHLIPDNWGAVVKWIASFSMFSLRYLLFAGVAYFIFYVHKREDWLFRKVQQKFPERKRIIFEVYHSFLTFCVFACLVLVLSIMRKHGLTQKYGDLSNHTSAYFAFSTVFIIFFHDTYFYWTHRLMHHPFLFRHVHKVHHMSNDPTPWAAFSFHPTEAVIEFAFVPFLAMVMPIHGISFLILGLWQITFNVMGHLGFEIFPKGYIRHSFFKWGNTSTHHNMHHKYVNCNYGLYFNIWDRLMSTNHKNYFKTFDEVTSRPRPTAKAETEVEQEYEPALR